MPQCQTGRHTAQPVATRRGAPIKVPCKLRKLKERRVEHVLDVVSAIRYSVEDTPDVAGMSVIEGPECREIPSGHSGKEFGVGTRIDTRRRTRAPERGHRKFAEAPNLSPEVHIGIGSRPRSGRLSLMIELGATSVSSVTVNLHPAPSP